MKNFLRPKYLPIFILTASVLGVFLRLWTLGAGPDSEGLYQPQPLAWTLLWIVTAAVPAVILLSIAGLKRNGSYADHFPKSVIGAVGTLLAAYGIIISGFSSMFYSADLLTTITGILGVTGGVAMVFVALARFQGRQPGGLFRILVCLYLALRIFACCRDWSNEPQISNFLFPLLASIGSMLACYHLCCFDANIGKRRQSIFWSLTSIYLCILAIPSREDTLLYCGIAVWLATNLCSLRPLKRKPVAEEAPVEESSTWEETTNTPEEM